MWTATPALSAMPLTRRMLIESQDVDETYETVSRVFKPHRLKCFGQPNLDARLHRLPFRDVALIYIQYGADVEVNPGSLDDFYLVHLPVRGRSLVSGPRSNVMTHPGRAAVCSPQVPYRFRWSEDCGVIAVRIPKDTLERHFQNLTGRPLHGELEFDMNMDLSHAPSKSWLGLLHYLLSDAEIEHGLTAQPAGAAQSEQMIMTALLTLQPHNHRDVIDACTSPAAPVYVRRAEDYMRAHLSEPLHMEDLAMIAGVSMRALHNGFRRFRGASPMAYFTQLRLEGARESLRSAQAGQTVADIAMQWGFYHLSSFAEKYRRRYGERPSETLRQR